MAGETGQDDQIIELTEVVDDGAADAPSDDDIIDLTDIDSESGDMTADDVQGDEAPPEEQSAVPDMSSVSMQEIEAALERVIEKKFAEKIEPLLFDTMERVILQEIKKIKTTLLKDMDQIGPF
ncbi:MAG: hypothetical protein K9J51_10860 [Desulfotignum sp.]|nr:hypothetical protein [Desulfotignum sp.]